MLKPDDVFPLGMAGNYKTNQFLWKPEEIGLLIRECHLEIFDKMTKLKPGGRLLISPEDFIRGLGTSISTSLAAIYLKEHSLYVSVC